MKRVSVVAIIAMAVTLMAPIASADHTPRKARLSPPLPLGNVLEMAPEGGEWKFIENIPPNPGSDLDIFERGDEVFGVFGSIGGGAGTHAGVRILRLAKGGNTNADIVSWISDFPTTNCQKAAGGGLSLQNDIQITPMTAKQAKDLGSVVGQIVIDTTDGSGRCHDADPERTARNSVRPTGGLELIDITNPNQPKEIHVVRLAASAHTATVDRERPWIVYVGNSDSEEHYIDVVNIRSCFGTPGGGEGRGAFTSRLRSQCKPVTSRLPFEDDWTIGRGRPIAGSAGASAVPFGCHDIVSKGDRIYCAAINASVIIDVGGMFDEGGNVKGAALECYRLAPGGRHPKAGNLGHPGVRVTGAAITDCSVGNSRSEWAGLPIPPEAEGFELLGIAHHGGVVVIGDARTRADQDVTIAHDAKPTEDDQTLLITDEHIGGFTELGPPCKPGEDDPFGNGGIHFYDLTEPSDLRRRRDLHGNTVVFRAKPLIEAASYCTVHLIDQAPGENRIFAAWYTQGLRVIDFSLNQAGEVAVSEIAHWVPTDNRKEGQWSLRLFLTKDHEDGRRTYYLAINDIDRGIDIVSFTAKPNPTPLSKESITKVLSAGEQAARWGSTGFLALVLILYMVVAARIRRSGLRLRDI